MVPVLLASLALGFTTSSVDMVITLEGKQVGTARMTQKLTPTGGKSTQTKIELSAQGKSSTVIEEGEYDADGKPLRKYMRKSGFDGTEMRVATFSDKGASVVTEFSGARETKKVPMPDGSTNAVSELWFIKNQPKAGDTATYYRFDMSKLDWVKSEITYKGKESVLGADTHFVEMKGAFKAWLTDDGLPVRMIAGKVVFERKQP